MDKLKLLERVLSLVSDGESKEEQPTGLDNGMIGKYVIVRCRDAGVHAGVLKSHYGRECVLLASRRLWYWKPLKGGLLSAVALYGLSAESKLGAPIAIHLTENCEIVRCSKEAEDSIRALPNTHE